MTAREYLGQLWELDRKIQQCMRQVEELKQAATGISAMTAGERVQTSGKSDRISSMVGQYVDLQQRIEAMIAQYMEKKTEILGQILDVKDDRHEEILFMRYVQGKSFDTIADELGYTYKWISHLHSQALKEFENTFLQQA